ncbi:MULTISPECIES: MFS transporter [unclassified Streptomyces]|uniref:MFS transporter n=1 Tax=unclassified Streptomyces TaxID=2593676 RepID=UPI000DC795BF|nr:MULTISPECIES: MFS transporter [unclassified Streptomyces]AWZ04488.1 MFS transporter [Streptomyces sp. ICC4]AWZ14153.1 MFS transporter [Streptomyces sp. ICC1]
MDSGDSPGTSTGTGGGSSTGSGDGPGTGDGSAGTPGGIPAAGSPAGGAAPPGRPRTAVVAALMLTMGLVSLDAAIVSTAVPQIVGDLGGFAVFSWIFSGYILAGTVTLPVYGKLSDTYGRKPVLLLGISLFLLGSLLCAAAWNMAALIAFRILQGLGGGALQGTVQTLAADLYPLKERPRIQARMSVVWATSALAGPALGGLIASYADWRWVFLLNLPLASGALWIINRHLVEPTRPPGRSGPVDWAGALAVFACGGLLLFALVEGGVAWPWLSAPSLGLLATSAALAALVVRIERRAAQPILPGWVWRRRTIAAVNLAMAALGLLMVAPMVFMPMYAQTVLGLGPTGAGLVTSAMTLSWPISAALAQHVYRRIGFRNTAATGVSLAAVILCSFTLLPYPAAPWQPAVIMLLLGAALGLFQLPLIVGVQSTVGWAERGTTTASVLFCRNVGQSIGAALLGAVANATIAGRLADAPVPGLPTRLDDVSQALDQPHLLSPAAAEYLRQAVAAAGDHIFAGATVAAVAAALVLLLVAPRRFPVLPEQREP